MQIIALVSFVIFAPSLSYAQSLYELDCPKGAYHGVDNQGNEACRDILTNEIVDSETQASTDSGKEAIADSRRGMITDSGRAVISDSVRGEVIFNDEQTDYFGIGILGLIGIIAVAVGVTRKKIVSGVSQMRGWSHTQKEQVRASQYDRCNMCYTKPTRWVYDHIDGNKRNNDLSNCQGLCPKCKSEKMMIRI